MITQTDVYYGTKKPKERIITEKGFYINTDIRSVKREIEGVLTDVWYATLSYIPLDIPSQCINDYIVNLQKTSDEQDELIAEILEGGNLV